MMKSTLRWNTSWKQVFHDIRAVPSLFLAFSAYKTLIILVFLETFAFPGFISIGQYSFPLGLSLLLTCTLLFGGVAVFYRRIHPFFDREELGLYVISMTGGIFFLFLYSHANIGVDLISNLCFGLGIVAFGVGLTGIHIELGRIFGFVGMTKTLTFGIAAAFAGTLFYLAVSFLLPSWTLWILALILPIVLVVAFAHARKKVYTEQDKGEAEPEEELFVPYRFMTTSLTQGLSVGLIIGFAMLSGFEINPLTTGIGYFLAAFLAFVVVLSLQVDFNRAVYQIGFPLICIGFIIVGLFPETIDSLGFIVQIGGFFYLDLVLWGLGSYLIKNCNQPAVWVASCPTTALMTGRLLGILAGCILAQSSGLREFIPQIFCIAGSVVLLIALYLLSSMNMKTGWGFVRPGDLEEDTTLARACQLIAQEFSLTKRELEIMRYIAAGETRHTIAEALHIAPNTVKTHMHNIYYKLDVHSEKDLRKLITTQQKRFSSLEDI